MKYQDLRDFIKQLEKQGELKRVTIPVDPYLEMTEICDRTLKQGGPALLFEYPTGYNIPVLANLFGTPRRVAMGMGAESVTELRGIGELLLLALIHNAMAVGARWVTLEVRVSNQIAQELYRKYGFEMTGRRKNYYSDNNEDALIMTTPLVTTIEYQLKLDGLQGALVNRLSR